jgi:anti-anti-sigma factor
VEGIPEIVLGTADFVSRPIIVLAQEEITHYIDQNKPVRLIINFQNVAHISSELITALIRIQDHVVGHGGQMKLTHLSDTVYAPFKLTNLAGRLFMIYETTSQAVDAF